MGIFSKMKVPLPKGTTKDDWKKYLKENKKQLLLILVAFVTLLAAFSVGVKSIVVLTVLIAFGAATAVMMSYTQLSVVLADFTLFGGLVGAHLFGPWFGILVLVAEYAIVSRFVSIDQIDIPVGVWFGLVILFVLPKLGFGSIILNLMIASVVGELGNFVYWMARGIPPPLLIIGSFVKFAWYLAFFIMFLPKIAAFLG